MVAFTVTCCAMAPAGVSPGLDVALPCSTVTLGVPSPGFFTSIIKDS